MASSTGQSFCIFRRWRSNAGLGSEHPRVFGTINDLANVHDDGGKCMQTEALYVEALEGPGVPEDQLSKIFNPFFRADDSRDASSGGIGLGLSIAQRAIRLHSDEIHAENANPGCAYRSCCRASNSPA